MLGWMSARQASAAPALREAQEPCYLGEQFAPRSFTLLEFHCQLGLLSGCSCVFERGKDALAFQVGIVGSSSSMLPQRRIPRP
jgi:hypothetical protein